MWLYCPPSISAPSPGSALLMSPSDEFFQRLSVSCTWRGKSRRWRLWRLAWKRATWMPRLFGGTFAQSQPTISEDVSAWWSAVSPAKTSALPARERESSGVDPDSSSTSFDSFATWEPSTSSWRTLQPSLFGGSTPFSGRWPKSGSLRSGAVCGRQTLVRLMAATVGGALRGTGSVWATPSVPNGGRANSAADVASKGSTDRGKRQIDLGSQARHWPTPQTADGERGSDKQIQGNPTLGGSARQWPTPYGFSGQGEGQKYGTGGEFDKFVKNWATSNANEEHYRLQGDSQQSRGLTAQASHWPTPRVSADRSSRSSMTRDGHWAAPSIEQVAELSMGELPREFDSPDELTPAASRIFESHTRPDPVTETAGQPTSTPTPTSRLQLNPQFVEALMGLPPEWTDFEGSATPSCPIRPSGPCASSGSERSE